MSGRYRQAKPLKRARRRERLIQVRLGRVIREVRRPLKKHPERKEPFAETLRKAIIADEQVRHSTVKLYSWPAPKVDCIGKGKADKPYEFGGKASITTRINRAPGGHFVLHAKAFHDRPYDGHTLNQVLTELEDQTDVRPSRVYVDPGYRGHDYPHPHTVFRSG